MTRAPQIASGGNRGPSRRTSGAPLSLQSFLPYRLNMLAHVVSKGFASAYSEIYGISAPEWRVVSTLGEFSQMTAKEISDHSGTHKATVSRAVLGLEKRHVLARVPSTADRREEILSLTPQGRRLYEDIAPMALRYERSLLEGLSVDDIAKLDGLIRHLTARAALPWFDAAAVLTGETTAKRAR